MWLATRAAIHRTGTHNHNLWFVAQSHPLANSILQVPYIHGVYSHFQRIPHFGVAPRQKQKPKRDGSTNPEAQAKAPPPLLQHGGDPLQVRQLQAHDPRGLEPEAKGRASSYLFFSVGRSEKETTLECVVVFDGTPKKGANPCKRRTLGKRRTHGRAQNRRDRNMSKREVD